MIIPGKPLDETQRLNALLDYEILDTLPESDFDDITRIAAEICQVPISLISLVDDERQWFKSHHGLETSETPRDYAFCAHAIKEPYKVLEVENSQKDERFIGNPIAVNAPNIIFYAGAPLVSPDGYAIGTLCVVDKNPKKLTTKQLDALQALSRQVVAQLELRKKISELNKKDVELRGVNERLSQFAQIVSHDIKSPLASLTSFVDLFIYEYGSSLDENGKKYISYISTSAERLRKLIDGILSYSTAQSINLRKKERIDVRQLLEEVIELVSPSKEFSFDFFGSFPVLKINRAALEQIFINLITNAIKYNDKSKGEIVIYSEETEDNWKFEVRDNGIGIRKEKHDHIFEIFKTLGNEDRFGNIGTGIGLSTVKNLVHKMGGQITLDSEVGKGTTFFISIAKR